MKLVAKGLGISVAEASAQVESPSLFPHAEAPDPEGHHNWFQALDVLRPNLIVLNES